MRRSRRAGDARPLLRDAHELALSCGARHLAQRAGNELAAAGGRPRPVAGSGADSLTPSERRVAELAAAGRCNREIAQQLAGLTDRQREVLALLAQGMSNAAVARRLVVSEKAVVQHCSNIYAALDLAARPDDHRRVLAVLRYLAD